MINFKTTLILGLSSALMMACASTSVMNSDARFPAGTGDIDSSGGGGEAQLFSYKLPINRNGQETSRVAYPFWSGEWPMPIIDVASENAGTTTIPAYKSLRTLAESEKVSCTIKNGVYHVWADKGQDPSAITYYTITAAEDYQVVRDTYYNKFNDKKGKEVKVKIPKGALITNVIYFGENYCGGTLKIGKTSRPIENGCDFFVDNKDLKRISAKSDFIEQWIYMSCEERDGSGKNVKAFVEDKTLLAQPGVTNGCPNEYGHVQGAKGCSH